MAGVSCFFKYCFVVPSVLAFFCSLGFMLNPESKEQYAADRASRASAGQQPASSSFSLPVPVTPPGAAPLWQPLLSDNVLNTVAQIMNSMGGLTQQAFGSTLANFMGTWLTNPDGSLLSLMFLN